MSLHKVQPNTEEDRGSHSISNFNSGFVTVQTGSKNFELLLHLQCNVYCTLVILVSVPQFHSQNCRPLLLILKDLDSLGMKKNSTMTFSIMWNNKLFPRIRLESRNFLKWDSIVSGQSQYPRSREFVRSSRNVSNTR